MTPRPLYLHVGASKTGTSALQHGLFDSVPALADQGIGVPLTGRNDHIRQLLRPLGWVTASGFTRDVRREALDELGPVLKSAAGERLLVTCEDLCEADQERIEALVAVADRTGQEVRVVITVRGLASVIPSEWQQFLKHRMTLDYPTFLTKIQHRKGRWATHFWLRQDLVAMCTRWAEVVGHDRIDVVVTPDRAERPRGSLPDVRPGRRLRPRPAELARTQRQRLVGIRRGGGLPARQRGVGRPAAALRA